MNTLQLIRHSQVDERQKWYFNCCDNYSGMNFSSWMLRRSGFTIAFSLSWNAIFNSSKKKNKIFRTNDLPWTIKVNNAPARAPLLFVKSTAVSVPQLRQSDASGKILVFDSLFKWAFEEKFNSNNCWFLPHLIINAAKCITCNFDLFIRQKGPKIHCYFDIHLWLYKWYQIVESRER